MSGIEEGFMVLKNYFLNIDTNNIVTFLQYSLFFMSIKTYLFIFLPSNFINVFIDINPSP